MKSSFFAGPVFMDFQARHSLSEPTLKRLGGIDQFARDTQKRLDEGRLHVSEAGNRVHVIEKKIRTLHSRSERKLLTDVLDNIRQRWAQAWRRKNKIFCEENNGLPPFRKADGTEIVFQRMDGKTGKGRSGTRYDASKAWPFISTELSCQERAALYGQLACRRVGESDLMHENERVMIEKGHMTVAANADITAGTCVGAYGGFVVEDHYYQLENDDGDIDSEEETSYMLGTGRSTDDGDIMFVDGNNILSRINTVFEWKDGTPVAQAKTGYNVEFADFKVLAKTGKTERLVFVFATRDIRAGQELRLNYGYTPDAIREIFSEPPSLQFRNMSIEEA